MAAKAILFIVMLVAGFVGPLLARTSRRRGEVVLVTHVGVGLAGFVAYLLWMANQ